MKEIEQLVYKRVLADNGTGGVLNLLGESLPLSGAPAHFAHSFQISTPLNPSLVYGVFASAKGTEIPRLTRDVFIAFNIYSQSYAEIGFRLMRLFDGIQHDLSVISGGATQIGGLSSVFDFEGPDGFDESLQVQTKDLRFRFFAVRKAQNPI